MFLQRPTDKTALETREQLCFSSARETSSLTSQPHSPTAPALSLAQKCCDGPGQLPPRRGPGGAPERPPASAPEPGEHPDEGGGPQTTARAAWAPADPSGQDVPDHVATKCLLSQAALAFGEAKRCSGDSFYSARVFRFLLGYVHIILVILL